MSRFKVLFLYLNEKWMNPPAVSIGLFAAQLKQNGFEADLFDTMSYSNRNESRFR